MSEAENRSINNLIVLCLEHASEVDENDRVAVFPVSLLREWKRGQLEDFDRLGHGGWNLSDAEVREVIESSFAESFDLRGSVIRLGGEGGRAPAAGGGGGGVLGAFAAAGAGGKGGDLTLDGRPGEAPGAGGGGAGAVGPGAVGGGGGGGGEYVERWFSADELPDVVEVKVGRGGQGVKGGDGLDGEDTSFGDLVVAQGGGGGRAGRLGESVHQAGDNSAIRVSSAFFANAAELRDGLFHVLGGGWSTYTVPTLPGVLSGCLVLLLEVDSPPPMVRYDVRFELVSPGGDVKGAAPITPAIDVPEQVTRVPWLVFLQTEVDAPGIWVARVSAGDHELTRLPIEVKAA